MNVVYKRCGVLFKDNVVIIVPCNKENKIDSIILTRVIDLKNNLKYFDFNNDVIQELRKQVQYLFQEGCYNISLVQSENCNDIIILI